jgi:hypothetical protein
MRIKNQILFCLSIMFFPMVSLGGSKSCCFAQLTAHNVQEILDAINIIKPKIIAIQIEINNINENLASCCETIISILDNIMVNVEISGIDAIETRIDECCNYLSAQDAIIISILDNLVVEVSGLDQILTCCEIIDSKIGDLDGPGTCLDSQIDVPEDINNLNLTVIQLL